MSDRFIISIVIPMLNEGDQIVSCLAQFTASPGCEVIVSDGGSSDVSCELAQSFLHVRTLAGTAGRAGQLNRGAEASGGEILWFLHADSRVPPAAAESILKALSNPGVVGGAFRFALDSNRFCFRLIEFFTRLRSEVFGLSYGDQGFFVRRTVFRELGGFPEVPILEDVYFWRKLRRCGKTVIIKDALVTSARRWETQGVLRTIYTHIKITLFDALGVPAEKLAKLRG